MASFDAIQTEVKARLGNRDNIDSRLPVWINDAYFELLLNPRFSFFELDKQVLTSTVNTLRAYALPADLWFILDIRIFKTVSGTSSDFRKLRRSHWMDFDKREPLPGVPHKYARFGATIEIDPTPDATYTMLMRYRFRPVELTTGLSPLIGREWDEVITVLSVIKGYDALEQPEEAAKQRTLLEQLLTSRLDVPQLEDMDAETTIGVRFN